MTLFQPMHLKHLHVFLKTLQNSILQNLVQYENHASYDIKAINSNDNANIY